MRRELFTIAFIAILLWQTVILFEGVKAQQEIKIFGTVLEYFKGGLGGPYGWKVRVDKVIFGSQVTGYIVKIFLQSVPPPWGYMDPDIAPGDTVEAYGHYSESGGEYRISLLGSEAYYLKKILLRPVGGYLVSINKLSLLAPYLALIVMVGAAVIVAMKIGTVPKARAYTQKKNC